MKRVYKILLITLTGLSAGYGANAERVDTALTEDQLKVARQYAADFGVRNIQSITCIKEEWHTMKGQGDLCVIGDEILTNNIGRYKHLYITHTSYDDDPPEPMRSMYYSDCILTIRAFVEFKLRGDTVKVVVDGADPELALALLSKIFANEYAVEHGVNAEEILQRLKSGNPNLLDFRFPWLNGGVYTCDYYKLKLDTDQSVYFTVDDKINIVIRDPG